MARKVMVRVGQGIVTVYIVATLAFIFQFIIPSDPAKAIAPRAKPPALALIRERLHLNAPLLSEYAHYWGDLLHGNLGYSYVLRQNVNTLVAERIGNTVILALAATVLQLLIGAGLAMLALRGPRLAKLVDGVNLVMIAAPAFTVALALILLFGFKWHLFPVTGGFGLTQLVLPALSLALASYPWYTQLIREEATQSLSSSYVRTAIAKGVPGRRILWTHAQRNILPPVLTSAALDFAGLLSGVAIIETIFGWPGIGQLAVGAFQGDDRPTAMAIVVIGAVAVVAFNIIVDFVNMYLDPRTRVAVS